MITDVATIITTLSLLAAVIGLRRNIKTQNTQAFFYLHEYLSKEEFSEARKRVRTVLYQKPYETWDEEDRRHANRVCASYDQAGILLGLGILDKNTTKKFLQSSWGDSIIDQYCSLKPFLEDQQTPTHTGKEFFRHFTWVYEETIKYQAELTD